MVLEGGSIDVNGLGTLLTTEECLLSPVQARNPGLARADWEAIFRDYLGATKVLWLGRGIAGDDTHGHVDDLARFVNPTTVVTVVESDRSDANYEPLQENLARLREMPEDERSGRPSVARRDAADAPAGVLRRAAAARQLRELLHRQPTGAGSHLQRPRTTALALNTLAGLFPDREVIGIAARDLVLGLGTLHCMTQQQPA